MKIDFLTPSGVVMEGECQSVVAPSVDGELGILDHHAPMMAALKEGVVKLTTGSGVEQYKIDSGFLQVADNQLHILAESAEKI